MPLDATPKSASANAYCTRAEATDYLTNYRLATSEWTAATDADKDKAIIWATAWLDAGFEWEGAVRTLTQALRWPRSGVRNDDLNWFDYDTIPQRLKNATAELAFAFIKKDRTLEPALLGQGFSEVSAGSIKVWVDPKMVVPIIPRHIISMLRGMGELRDIGMAPSDGVVKLQRA